MNILWGWLLPEPTVNAGFVGPVVKSDVASTIGSNNLASMLVSLLTVYSQSVDIVSPPHSHQGNFILWHSCSCLLLAVCLGKGLNALVTRAASSKSSLMVAYAGRNLHDTSPLHSRADYTK